MHNFPLEHVPITPTLCLNSLVILFASNHFVDESPSNPLKFHYIRGVLSVDAMRKRYGNCYKKKHCANMWTANDLPI